VRLSCSPLLRAPRLVVALVSNTSQISIAEFLFISLPAIRTQLRSTKSAIDRQPQGLLYQSWRKRRPRQTVSADDIRLHSPCLTAHITVFTGKMHYPLSEKTAAPSRPMAPRQAACIETTQHSLLSGAPSESLGISGQYTISPEQLLAVV
jgi:hypothetical protein